MGRKKADNPVDTWAFRQFSSQNRDLQIAFEYMRRHATSFTHNKRNVRNKTTLRNNFSPIRLAKIPNYGSTMLAGR